MIAILVDADACPVKEEIYRVAFRHEVTVKIVSNQRIRIPEHPLVERQRDRDPRDHGRSARGRRYHRRPGAVQQKRSLTLPLGAG